MGVRVVTIRFIYYSTRLLPALSSLCALESNAELFGSGERTFPTTVGQSMPTTTVVVRKDVLYSV